VRVAGARVVVTGAGSGIGEATARRFARAGAEVVALDIDADAARVTAAKCRELGEPACAYRCDVADPAAVVEVAQRIEREQGAVDVLVANAGVGLAGPFLDATLEDWRWIRGVNLDGVAHCAHAFGGPMVRRGHGHVVTVASAAGYVAHRALAAYCATKAGVIMLSQCLRADWSSSGVGVSVICPGVIDTPIAANTRMVGRLADRREAALRMMRRGRSPDAVARAILTAVQRNRAIVPVGVESALALRLLRVAPEPLQALVARTGLL